MGSCEDETKPRVLSEQESRLVARYGKLPAKRHLIQCQLENRKYFDSGDFALSAANTASDMGAVHTGTQQPLREHISHPSCPVPSGSNVKSSASSPRQGEEVSPTLAEESHLHEVMSANTTKFHDSRLLQHNTGMVNMFTGDKGYLTDGNVRNAIETLRANEDLQGEALSVSRLLESLKDKDPRLSELLQSEDGENGERRQALERELMEKMNAKGVVTDY